MRASSSSSPWTLAALAVLAVLGACGDGASRAPVGGAQSWRASIEPDGNALSITPTEPLRGGRTYGVVLTRGIRDVSARPLSPDAAFRELLGRAGAAAAEPVALYSADPEAEANPYPDSRLVRADGTIRVPDGWLLRRIVSEPASARTFLRALADEQDRLAGFGTTAPLRFPVSGEIDLDSVTAETLLFFERADGALDLAGLLAETQRRGVARSRIALAVSFPTQPIAGDLLAVRALLLERAAASPPRLELTDDAPEDDVAAGVFDRESPGPFAPLFAAKPALGRVARGWMRSPEFRDARGVVDPRRVAGEVPPEDVRIDVVLTVPGDFSAPHPVVLLQHGFGGSNLSFLEFAGDLAAEGLATVAISAVQHGRRGNPITLLDSTPLQTRDIFRQSNIDQMALVRLVEAGIDLDGDGASELDPGDIRYYGVSLGGLLGASFVPLEDAIRTAVLVVTGGRIAALGNAPAIRPLYADFFAERAGLPAESPEFADVLTRILELGQQGMDAADGLNFARHWFREPFGRGGKRILLQAGVGDDWVLNESTVELVTAAGIGPVGSVHGGEGVSGLWWFDPPDEPRGHGISGRPEVRAQARRFLASDGAAIVDPGGSDDERAREAGSRLGEE